MAILFRKSKKLGGARLTASKSGIGVSVGAAGLRAGAHTSGRRTVTAGVPGSGVRSQKSWGSKAPAAPNDEMTVKGQHDDETGIVSIACPLCNAAIEFQADARSVACGCGAEFDL
jgi:Protein of unknown function (DUF4236)